MASAARGSDRSEEPLAISNGARRTVITETIDLPEYREPRSRQTQALASIYGGLIRRKESLARRSIRPYFVPAPSSAPKQGFYASFGRWWSERGEADLLALPGVEETDGGLRYAGVDPSDDLPEGVSDDDVRPLEAFRSDPRVRARVALGDRYGPNADEIEEVLRIYDTVAAAGETTSEELGRDYRLDLESYADVLAGLPGIEREIETPPDPSEIKVETYADVLNARQRIDSPPTTVWRFDPEA